jgi:ATP-dependent DNA helicase RecG
MLYALLAGCGPMRVGEALGLEIDKHISSDFRTLYIRQKAKRGLIQPYLKTQNGERDIDLCDPIAQLLRDFIGPRTRGDADLRILTNSAVVRDFVSNVVPSTEPEEFLRKQSLIRDNRPTVAAVLLFADEPQPILPKHCGIKVYRFKTTGSEGFREAEAFIPKTVEGCLYRQISSAVSLTTEIIQQIPKMGEGAQFEAIQYPPQALHEIMAHRDYNIADDIHIRIFDNRIEVQSPGRLPANMTVKNLTTQRAARNGAIQRLLNKFPDPPNRDVGEGIKTAIAAMTALGLAGC